MILVLNYINCTCISEQLCSKFFERQQIRDRSACIYIAFDFNAMLVCFTCSIFDESRLRLQNIVALCLSSISSTFILALTVYVLSIFEKSNIHTRQTFLHRQHNVPAYNIWKYFFINFVLFQLIIWDLLIVHIYIFFMIGICHLCTHLDNSTIPLSMFFFLFGQKICIDYSEY